MFHALQLARWLFPVRFIVEAVPNSSVSVLSAARVGVSQRSEHRHYSIAR